MKPSEIKKNIINIIKDFSQEYSIAPQFVEKDYYVVKVLSEISKINYSDLEIIFSGGTCLSKAYNKIQRFSEDIDFRIHTGRTFSRAEKKVFCNFVIDKLNVCEEFKVLNESINKGNENNFFSFEIEYEKLYNSLTNLRPNIKVEFTFENLILPSNTCEVSSFISPYMNSENVFIKCIQPIEVIANKFSALMWRVYIKDRTKPLHTKENDPTIVRHLHDISALDDVIQTKEFIGLLQKSFDADKGRGRIKEKFTIQEFIKMILDKLTNDELYKKEYSDFVASMYYGAKDEMITFEKALIGFRNLYKFMLANCNKTNFF